MMINLENHHLGQTGKILPCCRWKIHTAGTGLLCSPLSFKS